MRLASVVLIFFLAAAAYAQTPAKFEFEVASVKPSNGSIDQVTAGFHVDGAQLHIADVSLRDYIRIAYRVKLYQVTGPAELSARFNIDAKLPEGATREQVPEMLQSLLASRFEMKIHRETKDFPVYALTASASGVKIKESAPDADAAPAATSVSAAGNAGGVALNFGHGSTFSFGNGKLAATKVTMANFADTLSRFVDRPVVDRTKLAGSYDLSLELTPDDYRTMLIQSAATAGVQLPPQALRLLDGATDDSLYSGLRKLGLQLSPGKAPLEVLVVDHILKSPIEN